MIVIDTTNVSRVVVERASSIWNFKFQNSRKEEKRRGRNLKYCRESVRAGGIRALPCGVGWCRRGPSFSTTIASGAQKIMVYTSLAINGHYNTSMLIKKMNTSSIFVVDLQGWHRVIYYQSGGGLSLIIMSTPATRKKMITARMCFFYTFGSG